MEEEKKLKKKKILKVIKMIGYAFILLSLIICAIGSCKKANALEPINNYNMYSCIGKVAQLENYNGSIKILSFEDDRIYLNYGDGNYQYDIKYTHYTFFIDIDILEDEIDEELKITSSDLVTGQIVVFGGFVNNQDEEFEIQNITILSKYFDKITTTSYNEGGQSTLSQSQSTSYSQGFAEGKRQAEINYTEQLNGVEDSYQLQIDQLNDEINRLQTSLDNGGTWATFRNLLITMMGFPIRFFKEGFNVEVFGVNIGGLIVGVMMIGITLAIVGLILGRRKS